MLLLSCWCPWYVSCKAGLQESSLSAFSQWRAAASSPDLPAFLADTAQVRTALVSISQAQATAGQLAKTIADKTEAGSALLALPVGVLTASLLCWDQRAAQHRKGMNSFIKERSFSML